MNPIKSSAVEWPVSFRVIGIGEETNGIISQVNSLGYPGVKAIQYTNQEVIPEEEDKMVILLNPSNKEIHSLSKSFYQAGVLTLIISTVSIENQRYCFDSYTLIGKDKILPTVKSIFDPIFHNGPISFDFNDISSTLKDSNKFIIRTYKCNTSKYRTDGIIKKLKKDLVNLEEIENLTFIISYNPGSNLPLTVDELNPLQTFFMSLPKNINIIWGVQFDDSLDSNELKLSVIASGKDLNLILIGDNNYLIKNS